MSVIMDHIRPFAPGFRKFLAVIVCLQSVATALMVNSVVAFSLLIIFSAFMVRIYKVDPEPVLLLMLHTVVSGCMLCDVTATLSVMAAVLTSLYCLGDFGLHGDRVTVIVTSTLLPGLLGKPQAVIACVLIAVIIVAAKLRPFRPPMLVLSGLSFIALTLLVNRMAASVLVFVLMAITTALFVINKVKPEDDLPDIRDIITSANNKNNNNNSNTFNKNDRHGSIIPNGYLQLTNPTDSLDLHGHTVTGAMKMLNAFLRESEDAYRENRTNHLRHVTIITGEGQHDGEHSPAPLIKPTVINFLKINKYLHEVSSETPGLVKVDLESHVT